jgi:glycine/D-amino acid oxidase-like deaminating enzyme
MQWAEERSDVIIGGGGAVGLALACALADALGPDCRIAVADRMPFGSGERTTSAPRPSRQVPGSCCRRSASGRRLPGTRKR